MTKRFDKGLESGLKFVVFRNRGAHDNLLQTILQEEKPLERTELPMPAKVVLEIQSRKEAQQGLKTDD
jgi:cell division protein FtsX